MAVIRNYRPGEFCWTDLGTTDVARSSTFYQSIFGWERTDFPMGPGDAKYSMLRVDGEDACALYPMSDEQMKMAAPPSWLPYISVDSVDETVEKAKAAGGSVCLGPMDVMDKGRMAIIQDPTGAGFAIWQAGAHRGAGLDETPRTVCWHDLSTPKPEAAGMFYTKVFDWSTKDQDFGGNTYHRFRLGEDGVCGMWPEPMKRALPSWVTYWKVSNCAETVANVERLGGGVLLGSTPVPGMCRFAILTDPQGATFGILEPED